MYQRLLEQYINKIWFYYIVCIYLLFIDLVLKLSWVSAQSLSYRLSLGFTDLQLKRHGRKTALTHENERAMIQDEKVMEHFRPLGFCWKRLTATAHFLTVIKPGRYALVSKSARLTSWFSQGHNQNATVQMVTVCHCIPWPGTVPASSLNPGAWHCLKLIFTSFPTLEDRSEEAGIHRSRA